MRKSEWAEMHINGILGYIHKLVMWLTLPIRKFWYFLLAFLAVLAVLIIIPMCYNVKFSEIAQWYRLKIPQRQVEKVKKQVSSAADSAVQKITQKVGDIKEKVEEILPDKPSADAKEEEKEEVKFVSWNVAKFNKVRYSEPEEPMQIEQPEEPSFAEISQQAKKEQELQIKQEQQQIDDQYRDVYYEGNLADYYRVRRDLGLVYLSESEKLYDKAKVVGPNSLYINDTFVFLYGIYTNPDTYDTAAAQRYLDKLTDGQMVHCDVVAYTQQTQAATALCFVNGIFINRALVENNLAKNVALK